MISVHARAKAIVFSCVRAGIFSVMAYQQTSTPAAHVILKIVPRKIMGTKIRHFIDLDIRFMQTNIQETLESPAVASWVGRATPARMRRSGLARAGLQIRSHLWLISL